MAAGWAPEAKAASPIYASAGAKLGYGKAYSADKASVPSRTLLVPAVEGMLAVRMRFFFLGLAGDFALWRQLTDPKNISDSNLQGTMATVTPVLGLGNRRLSFMLRYFPVYARYELSRADRSGQAQAYLDADQLVLQLRVGTAGGAFFGIEYAKTEFKKRETAGREYALTTGNEMEFRNLGVAYGFVF